MLKDLIKVANRLDALGLTKEADTLDRLISRAASSATDYDVEGLERDLGATPIGGSEESEAAFLEGKSDVESSHRMEEDLKERLRTSIAEVRAIANMIAEDTVYGSDSEDSGEEMGLLYKDLYGAADEAGLPREMADQFVEEAEKKHKAEKWAERRRSRYGGY
jgi:hypothetical protein